jgi:hypothetical protein
MNEPATNPAGAALPRHQETAMRHVPGLALLGVLCLGGPAFGQGFFANDPLALVSYWYDRYFSRPADPIGLAGWAQMLQTLPPANELSAMLSSPEYFARAGNTPPGFVHTLFRDVTGRAPTRREFNWMMNQLAFDAGPWPRATLAYNVLQRYPQGLFPPVGWGTAVPPPPGRGWGARPWQDFDYRRPDWRFRP